MKYTNQIIVSTVTVSIINRHFCIIAAQKYVQVPGNDLALFLNICAIRIDVHLLAAETCYAQAVNRKMRSRMNMISWFPGDEAADKHLNSLMFAYFL